jgi:hypothetical protein
MCDCQLSDAKYGTLSICMHAVVASSSSAAISEAAGSAKKLCGTGQSSTALKSEHADRPPKRSKRSRNSSGSGSGSGSGSDCDRSDDDDYSDGKHSTVYALALSTCQCWCNLRHTYSPYLQTCADLCS